MAVLIALGGGALATGAGHPERGQQAPEQHAMGDRNVLLAHLISGGIGYGLSVSEQRWPWLVTAGLMLAAAVAAAWSTYLHWLPCQGSMSRDECWRRMDAGISFTGMGFPYLPDLAEAPPWVSELGTAATVLVGVAWLTLVLGMRWQLKTKAVAALPGLATLVAAYVGTVDDASTRGDAFLAFVAAGPPEAGARVRISAGRSHLDHPWSCC